ncbi:MAG: 1-deoxy-D-xylulose-5-phosphate reductoisomerase, partial [Muribaculaceae bacterium]|nr:1-deoxy-D-xylulose-5-phosphate reductoisomerase [Muribaculaceae bacterium]
MKRNIAILGSTGSIGTQTLDIISENPDILAATVLTARRNWQLLAEQAKRFSPVKVVIGDEEYLPMLRDALKDTNVTVEAGADAIAEAAAMPEVDTVVTAMVGYSGLIPTINAIKAEKR